MKIRGLSKARIDLVIKSIKILIVWFPISSIFGNTNMENFAVKSYKESIMSDHIQFEVCFKNQ